MRAAARLRTHAIGNYARPETEAPRTTFALALLAAAGVLLPWAEGFDWSKRGWSYHHGLIALVAAIEAAIVYALRASGNITRRQYFAFGLAFALAGLGATLWFYFDVVGSVDPIVNSLISFFKTPRESGAIGVYVSMAGFLGQVVVLLWHLDWEIQQRTRLALRSPWATAMFVGLAAIGVLLPWQRSWWSSEPGWSFNYGLVALVAAIEAGIVCGLRISGNVRLTLYALVGLLSALFGLGAVVWFHYSGIGTFGPDVYRLPARWLTAPRTSDGIGESASAVGFIGMIAVLTWQLWQGRRTAD